MNNTNYNRKFNNITIFNFEKGSAENMKINETFKFKKNGSIKCILFKNIDVEQNIYYSGRSGRKYEFINQLHLPTKRSRVMFVLNRKKEFIESEDFHLGIDKHKILLVSVSNKKYCLFRTSTRKILKRIPREK